MEYIIDRNIILTTNYSKHIWAWNTKFKDFWCVPKFHLIIDYTKNIFPFVLIMLKVHSLVVKEFSIGWDEIRKKRTNKQIMLLCFDNLNDLWLPNMCCIMFHTLPLHCCYQKIVMVEYSVVSNYLSTLSSSFPLFSF